MEIKDKSGRVLQMYLYPERKMLPIPKFYWKIVSEPSTKRAIAFVTSNDPSGDYETVKKVCKRDVCEEAGWLEDDEAGEFKNGEHGATICCEVADLRSSIPHVPDVRVENLLKADVHRSSKFSSWRN